MNEKVEAIAQPFEADNNYLKNNYLDMTSGGIDITNIHTFFISLCEGKF
jgi:hypothetical protein